MVNIRDDILPVGLAIYLYQVFIDPHNDMVLECPLDYLVKEIR